MQTPGLNRNSLKSSNYYSTLVIIIITFTWRLSPAADAYSAPVSRTSSTQEGEVQLTSSADGQPRRHQHEQSTRRADSTSGHPPPAPPKLSPTSPPNIPVPHRAKSPLGGSIFVSRINNHVRTSLPNDLKKGHRMTFTKSLESTVLPHVTARSNIWGQHHDQYSEELLH